MRTLAIMLAVLTLTLSLSVTAAHAAPWQYLVGHNGQKIENLSVDFTGTGVVCKTTDGAVASSKVCVEKLYAVMSTYGGRRPYKIAVIRIRKTAGSVAEAKIHELID